MRFFHSPPCRSSTTAGFTLVEVVIAMLIFTVGALSLAAASAAIVRQMAANAQRGYVASLAGNESERLQAAACSASASGSQQTRGVLSSWSVQRSAAAVELDHRLDRSTSFGNRQERFMSGVTCE